MSKKSTVIPVSIEAKIVDNLIALKALKEHSLEIYKGLDRLAKDLEQEHFATQEAVANEIIETKKVIGDLLASAVDKLQETSLGQMPDNPKAMTIGHSEELIASQRDKIRLALKQSGVFNNDFLV